MFKKILLATLVLLGVMWGVGFDFGGLKDDIVKLADGNASELTGGTADNDWAD